MPAEQTGDPVLRAVLALEALPQDRWTGVWALAEARADAAKAQARVEEILVSLGVVA